MCDADALVKGGGERRSGKKGNQFAADVGRTSVEVLRDAGWVSPTRRRAWAEQLGASEFSATQSSSAPVVTVARRWRCAFVYGGQKEDTKGM